MTCNIAVFSGKRGGVEKVLHIYFSKNFSSLLSLWYVRMMAVIPVLPDMCSHHGSSGSAVGYSRLSGEDFIWSALHGLETLFIVYTKA